MRALEALVLLALVGAGSWASVKLILSGLRRRHVERAEWEVVPKPLKGGGTAIYLERDGEDPYLVEELSAPVSDEEFDEAVIRAELRRSTLNRTLR